MHELTTLHDAIEAQLVALLPQVQHVEAFPKLDQDLPMPALLFALTGMRPAEDDGTGRAGIEARFQGCVLVEIDRERAPLQAAILATKLTEHLRGQTWGLEFVEVARDVAAWPDKSTPELDAFAVWVVEWSHVIRTGPLAQWPDEAQRILWALDPQPSNTPPDIVDPEELDP